MSGDTVERYCRPPLLHRHHARIMVFPADWSGMPPFCLVFLFLGSLECEIVQHARETLDFAIIHSAC